MCKWGTITEVVTCKPVKKAWIQYNSTLEEFIRSRQKLIEVDDCIAPLVQVLNDYGIETLACCCTHGKAGVSSIKIHPRNIKLSPVNDTFVVWLEFPYPGEDK